MKRKDAAVFRAIRTLASFAWQKESEHCAETGESLDDVNEACQLVADWLEQQGPTFIPIWGYAYPAKPSLRVSAEEAVPS